MKRLFAVFLLGWLASAGATDSRVYVDQGQDVTLSCTRTGETFMWALQVDDENRDLFFNQKRQAAAVSSKYSLIEKNSRYNLRISDVQPADDGTYLCYTLEKQSDKDRFQLIAVVKPTKLQISGDAEGLDEGSTGKITCNVTSAKPRPKLAWKKKGQNGYQLRSSNEDNNLVENADGTFATTLTLELTVTKSLLGSTYVCEVTLDGVTWNMSKSHAIVVNTFPSKPTVSLRANSTVAGSTYTAMCASNGGRPTPRISWYLGPSSDPTRIQLNGSHTSSRNSDDTFNVTSTLRQTAQREHNQWRLTCTVTNRPLVTAGLDPRRAYTVLDVWYKPVIKSAKTSMETPEGADLNLTCIVDANPVARVTWFHAKRRVNATIKGYLFGNDTSPSLYIPVVKHSDEGRWQCQASNILGTIQGSIQDVDVKHAPVFTMGPAFPLVGVVAGRDVTLTCKVKADPVALEHLHWYSDRLGRIEKNTSDFYVGAGNESLTILKTGRVYAGMYYCSAKNSLGMRTSAKLELQVQYEPEQIKLLSASRSYKEDSIMSNITCSAKGKPDVQYSWTLNGQPYGGNDSVIYFDDLAKPEYRGAYACTTSNFLGSLSKQIFIDVMYAPYCVKGQKVKYGVSVGKSVTVLCKVTANPRQSGQVVMTYGSRKERRTSVRETDADDSTIFTARVTHKASSAGDYGNYYCNASSSLGWMRRLCIIQVVPSSAPDAPANCHTADITDAAFTVMCEEGFDGGSTVTFDLQFLSGGDGVYHSVLHSQSPQMKVASRQPGTIHVMRLCTSNEEYPAKKVCSPEFDATTTGNNGVIKKWKPSAQISLAYTTSAVSYMYVMSALLVFSIV